MTQEQGRFDSGRLARLWWASVFGGLIVLGGALVMLGVFESGDWLAALIALAIGAFAFSGMFFVGANLIGLGMEKRVRDETRVRGASVEHVTHVEMSGDASRDKWLERYVFSRNLFGGLLVPLAILAGLFIFS